MLSGHFETSACLSASTIRADRFGLASASYTMDFIHWQAVMGLSSVACPRYSPITSSILPSSSLLALRAIRNSRESGRRSWNHASSRRIVHVRTSCITRTACLLKRPQRLVGLFAVRRAKLAHLLLDVHFIKWHRCSQDADMHLICRHSIYSVPFPPAWQADCQGYIGHRLQLSRSMILGQLLAVMQF